MNETYTAEQKQIFDVPLEGADAEAIKALVDKHKANAALTQQMALDASRLVSTSQERLAKQAEAGFFKRLASALSGKTSENQLLNQKDMLQMQKFAWHYLQQLQQQNLINAQSIAVIRNNLGTMNEYIIETRDFLEQAIEKIDHRLRHVEKNTNFNNWALNIESNKRRFKSTPKNLLILRLTYDFMRSHRDLVLTDRDVSNYLVTTLEKLDINCDENVRLLDFISELIDQVEVVGIDQYRAMIELSFDEHSVNSEYIQKNISGIGFNALYFLSDNYDKIVDLIGDNELCNSDEAREKIISKFFGNEFSGLSTAYAVRNLVCEVIGGSQIAIDIYREEHGLNVVQEEIAGESQPEVVKLVSSLPDVQAHTFLDNNNGGESNRNYLLLLALCIENAASLNEFAKEFIELLAKKSGLPDLLKVILELADNPRKHVEYQPVMQALLDDDDKKYTWLLDAFFLLKLANKEIENQRIKAILDILKPFQAKECLPNMLMIINGSDESQVMDAVTKLATHTQGWRNIIRYRELRFDKCFDEVLKQLYSASLAINRIGLEMTTVYMKAAEYAVHVSFNDGSFLNNLADKAASAVCTLGRRSALSSLNEIRKKGADCVLENRSALFRANSLISRWGMPDFEFKDEMHRSDFDLNNSAENEDWDRQFDKYYHQVENTLNSFSHACDDAAKQIELFAKGNFDQSVLKLREIEHAEYLRQQQLEKLEKQSVTIVKNGTEHFFSIEWQQVEKPPCDPGKIQDIKTDGKVWLVVAKDNSDEVFCRSENGRDWQQVQIDTEDSKFCFKEIDIVNGLWIIKNREYRNTRPAGIYYSSDAILWRYSCGPGGPKNGDLSLNDGHLSYEEVIYFNGLWLWRITKLHHYSYTEKGFFSNSTKTDSYFETILYYSTSLDGPWERWDQSPKLPEGSKVEAIYSLPGRDGLLAFCKYDNSYIKNKIKPEEPPFVMYYGAAKTWQKCTWGGHLSSFSVNPYMFILIGGNLMCFDGWSCEILTSDKGYEWLLTDIKLDSKCTGYCALNDLNLFISRDSSLIYLSQDAKLFKEIKLEDGNWRYLAANEKGILSKFNANEHEATVLRVGRYICQPKTVSQT